MENIPTIKIALGGNTEIITNNLTGLFAQNLGDFLRRPQIVFALNTLAIGVLGAIEAAVRVSHLSENIVQSLFSYRAK